MSVRLEAAPDARQGLKIRTVSPKSIYMATLVDELILASLIWSLLIKNKKTSNNLIELMTIGKDKLFSEPCFSVWVNLV